MSALQLLLAVCQHRGGEILEELHVETLGTMPSESEPPTKVLESFSAVVMPRNEVETLNTRSLWLIVAEPFEEQYCILLRTCILIHYASVLNNSILSCYCIRCYPTTLNYVLKLHIEM